jgi:hypothetical protein
MLTEWQSTIIFWVMILVLIFIAGILAAGHYFLIAYICGGFSYWVAMVKLKNGMRKNP